MKNANDFLELTRRLRDALNLGRPFLITDLSEIHIEDPSRQLIKALGITPEGINTISRGPDPYIGNYPWKHSFFFLNIHYYWISSSQNPFPEVEAQND